MMRKNLRHAVAIALLVAFAVLALGSTTTPRIIEEEARVDPARPFGYSFRSDLDYSRATILRLRDWVSVGLIFVTSTKRIDANGNIVSGSIVTNEMLMREAQRLGAHDIINVRKDRIEFTSPTGERQITFKANALAIRYLERPEVEWALTYILDEHGLVYPELHPVPLQGPGLASPERTQIPMLGILPFLGR